MLIPQIQSLILLQEKKFITHGPSTSTRHCSARLSPSSMTLVLLSHRPQPCFHGLGCSHFIRCYYKNHFCFLFLWLLRYFSLPSCLLTAYGFSNGSKGCTIWESLDLSLFSILKHLINYYALSRLCVPRYPS